MRLYLDTNAASYLHQHQAWSSSALARVRKALAVECAAGRIELVTSASVIEELTGIGVADMRRYVRTVRFVLDLAGRRFQLPVNERIKAEVSHGGRLTGQLCFIERPRLDRLRQRIMSRSFVREIADAVRADVEHHKREMESRRTAVRSKMGDDWSAHTAHWWNDAVSQIDEWTRDYFRASRHVLRLPANESQWPAPRDVPTAWHTSAYYMARIALNVGQNRRIGGSDRYDHAHYANATYADLTVTDDKAFLETYRAIPEKPFAIESFAAFASRLGVDRS